MKLTIIRGLPGSGKSTKAHSIGGVHYEADMYFMRNGVYRFNPILLGAAHQWCLHEVERSLKYGIDVVVSNTFLQWKEIKPYVKIAREVEGCDVNLITLLDSYGSIHAVPDETLNKMQSRMENHGGIMEKLLLKLHVPSHNEEVTE